MKKWLSFVLLFAAVLMTNVLVSCGDDNNDDPTVASVAGTYTGTDSLHFAMGATAYKAGTKNVQYVVKENSDKTINVTFPEETYDFSATVPMVGKIVQGGYTVKNIPFDKAKKAYYLDYSKQGAKAHVSIPNMKIDKDYDVISGQITVSFTGNTMSVINLHQFGVLDAIDNEVVVSKMPMPLTATFIGTK